MGASEVAVVVGAGVITGLGLYVATGGFTKGLVLKKVAGYDNEPS